MAWLPTHVAKPSFNLNKNIEIELRDLLKQGDKVDYGQNLIVIETLIGVMSNMSSSCENQSNSVRLGKSSMKLTTTLSTSPWLPSCRTIDEPIRERQHKQLWSACWCSTSRQPSRQLHGKWSDPSSPWRRQQSREWQPCLVWAEGRGHHSSPQSMKVPWLEKQIVSSRNLAAEATNTYFLHQEQRDLDLICPCQWRRA